MKPTIRENKEKFEYLWTQIATRFKNYDQHLVFEGYNEMLDADNTWNAPKSANSYNGFEWLCPEFRECSTCHWWQQRDSQPHRQYL